MAVKRTKKSAKKKGRADRSVIGTAHRLRKKPDAPPPASPDDSPSGSRPPGVLRIAPDADQLPEAFVEAGEGESDEGPAPGRVMLTITLLAIAFIAIIAWFVS